MLMKPVIWLSVRIRNRISQWGVGARVENVGFLHLQWVIFLRHFALISP